MKVIIAFGRFQKCSLYLNFHLRESKASALGFFFFKKRMLSVDNFKISYLNNTWIGILFWFVLFSMVWKREANRKSCIKIKDEINKHRSTWTMEGTSCIMIYKLEGIYSNL